MTKHPRDPDEPICEWCDGTGWWEAEPAEPFNLELERRPCEKCKGAGVAKFDPADLLARLRGHAG